MLELLADDQLELYLVARRLTRSCEAAPITPA